MQLRRSSIVSASHPNRPQFLLQHWKAPQKSTSINNFRCLGQTGLRQCLANFLFSSRLFPLKMHLGVICRPDLGNFPSLHSTFYQIPEGRMPRIRLEPRLCYLARPMAATKYPTLAIAARVQLSAFSSQPLNKHSQHAFDFGDLLRQFFIILGLDQFQVVS